MRLPALVLLVAVVRSLAFRPCYLRPGLPFSHRTVLKRRHFYQRNGFVLEAKIAARREDEVADDDDDDTFLDDEELPLAKQVGVMLLRLMKNIIVKVLKMLQWILVSSSIAVVSGSLLLAQRAAIKSAQAVGNAIIDVATFVFKETFRTILRVVFRRSTMKQAAAKPRLQPQQPLPQRRRKKGASD